MSTHTGKTKETNAAHRRLAGSVACLLLQMKTILLRKDMLQAQKSTAAAAENAARIAM
jgi:hypothetical protein